MNVHDYGPATFEVPPPARWMPRPVPPLSRTTGGRNLAHHMGTNSPRKRRLLWRLPRSLVDYWMPFGLIIGLTVGLWALYTWG